MAQLGIKWRFMIFLAAGFLIGSMVPVWAQEEVGSRILRYRDYEVSNRYYEQYEMRPSGRLPIAEVPGLRGGLLPYSPSAAQVRIRTRLSDSHRGIRFYRNLTCVYCHPREAEDIHTTRANLTCRQCHGGEPIASIQHYYSPMNPIRRHAYVCSKCHEGSNVLFGAYVVHEPSPVRLSTLNEFPALFVVFWLMIAIAVGTFAVFLPHTAAWGVRELLMKKGKFKREPKTEE